MRTASSSRAQGPSRWLKRLTISFVHTSITSSMIQISMHISELDGGKIALRPFRLSPFKYQTSNNQLHMKAIPKLQIFIMLISLLTSCENFLITISTKTISGKDRYGSYDLHPIPQTMKRPQSSVLSHLYSLFLLIQ